MLEASRPTGADINTKRAGGEAEFRRQCGASASEPTTKEEPGSPPDRSPGPADDQLQRGGTGFVDDFEAVGNCERVQ